MRYLSSIDYMTLNSSDKHRQRRCQPKEEKMKSKTKTKDFTSPRKNKWEIQFFCQKFWAKYFLKDRAHSRLKRGRQKVTKNFEMLSTSHIWLYSLELESLVVSCWFLWDKVSACLAWRSYYIFVHISKICGKGDNVKVKKDSPVHVLASAYHRIIKHGVLKSPFYVNFVTSQHRVSGGESLKQNWLLITK